MLLAAIDERHKGTYDFVYLPIDFKASAFSFFLMPELCFHLSYRKCPFRKYLFYFLCFVFKENTFFIEFLHPIEGVDNELPFQDRKIVCLENILARKWFSRRFFFPLCIEHFHH